MRYCTLTTSHEDSNDATPAGVKRVKSGGLAIARFLALFGEFVRLSSIISTRSTATTAIGETHPSAQGNGAKAGQGEVLVRGRHNTQTSRCN